MFGTFCRRDSAPIELVYNLGDQAPIAAVCTPPCSVRDACRVYVLAATTRRTNVQWVYPCLYIAGVLNFAGSMHCRRLGNRIYSSCVCRSSYIPKFCCGGVLDWRVRREKMISGNASVVEVLDVDVRYQKVSMLFIFLDCLQRVRLSSRPNYWSASATFDSL